MTSNQKKYLKKITNTNKKEAEVKARIEQENSLRKIFFKLLSRGDIGKGDLDLFMNLINNVDKQKLIINK